MLTFWFWIISDDKGTFSEEPESLLEIKGLSVFI